MADEDNEPDQDAPEPEPRLFTLSEAERARRELEPSLVEAMDCRKKLAGLDNDFTAVSARIMMMGGLTVPCLLYTSPSPRDLSTSRMPSSA